MAEETSSLSVDDVWSVALEKMRKDSSLTPQHRSFIRLVKPLAVVDDNVFLAVAEDFTKNYLESQLREPLTQACLLYTSPSPRDA